MAKKKSLNLPYEYMTREKWNSLGQTMTLKEACDLGWNSVRVRTKGREDDYSRVRLCYRCNDGDYELDELPKKLLITLDDEYDEDSDGYPIIFATEITAPESLI